METSADRPGSKPLVDKSQVLQISDYGLDILAKINSARADASSRATGTCW